MSKTLFDKIWDRHIVVAETSEHPCVLAIDLHLIHEVTSPQAFAELDRRGLRVARPSRTLATTDHSTPTSPTRADGSRVFVDQATRDQVECLRHNAQRHGIPLYALGGSDFGVVHVLGPELGLTQPGMTVVCGDSHTSTHGAFGALAFGIGTSEVTQVLATQCLLQRRPRSMRVRFAGQPGPEASAKDLALAMIASLGTSGGQGHVLEFVGPAVEALSMEGRMTLCNMSIEAGARAGMIAPDATTIAWLRARPGVPQGQEFEAEAQAWLQFHSDADAVFDAEHTVDVAGLGPRVTWGTDPSQSTSIDGRTPLQADARAAAAMAYMGWQPGQRLQEQSIDVVFVGSCTNGRLEDLRAAAQVLQGERVAARVRMLVVPGSRSVQRAAEAEGLDQIFRAAGAEWREPGCSMCIAMNGDQVAPGKLAVSTSNRNFVGRQGPQSRTVLASPAVAAASAIAGFLSSPRLLRESSVS
jgi:3-isopropylmalate/(R)-2-methylmalate dehydratase large subunit